MWIGCSDPTWHLGEFPGLNVEKAWEITRGSKDVTIAVIDAGIQLEAYALNGPSGCGARSYTYRKMYRGPDAPDSPGNDIHGTWVMSFVGACGDQDAYQGVNAQSPIIGLETSLRGGVGEALLLWAAGYPCDTSYLQDCQQLPKPIDVINASWGSTEEEIQRAISAKERILKTIAGKFLPLPRKSSPIFRSIDWIICSPSGSLRCSSVRIS